MCLLEVLNLNVHYQKRISECVDMPSMLLMILTEDQAVFCVEIKLKDFFFYPVALLTSCTILLVIPQPPRFSTALGIAL